MAAMESFSCLAERCEDSCCRDWIIPIDRESFERMRRGMTVTPEGRERLVRLVVVGQPSGDTDRMAVLKVNDQGACTMLGTDQRCGIQTEFGEATLPTACSIFPRTALAVAGRLEVGGDLACPEVSRLVLLTKNGPDLADSRRSLMPRAYVGRVVNPDPGDAYAYHLPAVRDRLFRLLGLPNHPPGARLVFAADFAEAVGSFYYANTPEFSGTQNRFSERRLDEEMRTALTADHQRSLADDFTGLRSTGEGTVAMIVTLLSERQRLPHSARFADLVRDVMTSIQKEVPGGPVGIVASPATMWQVYARRREAVNVRAGARSDLIFGNFARHFLLRSPHTDSATLSEHLYRLAIQLAAVRFLTVTHPDLEARLAAPPDAAADEAVLSRVAIHAIQTFSKAIGHHRQYLDTIIHSRRQSGGFSFGQLVMLARFI
ncbi:MAG TPA: flagellin lysine-N-methylase [Polyangia bacterium]|nr:flagellin lysine-N-methylase [Polyangia bacterium]